MTLRPVAFAATVMAVPLVIAACGSSTDATADGATAASVSVTASETACTLGETTVPTGAISFDVTNTGDQVTEVYVYGKSGEAFTLVVAEVENVGPGTSRDMTADLAPGTYEIACKPGQTGDGIRTQLAVTGDTASPSTTAMAVAAREITLTIDSSDQLTGTDGQSATIGETLEFAVTNTATGNRVFEVKRPDGSVAGEIEIDTNAEGELVISAGVAGDWKLIVEGGNSETETKFPVR